ncbi:MAG TPA: septum formation initiator family protein [Dehalococcoidia bacterium]|jgi:cell division protein FtsL|nr:septum formation initiator family protein [Dehalococcoidia bacterium]
MATLDRLGPAPAVSGLPASTWRPRRAIAVALIAAAAIALLQVVQSSSFAHTGQQMRRLETERATLKAEVYDLEAEVAALSSLERTERAAKERLGMIQARTINYMAVEVEAPSGPLLPRPLVTPPTAPPPEEPWWESALRALPIP